MSVDNIVRFVEECSNRPDFYLGFPHTYHYDYRLFLQTELKSENTSVVEYHSGCGCGEDKVKSFLYFWKNSEEIVRCVQQMNKTALIDSGVKDGA